MESTLYKITSSKMHSGIFYGPYTFIYGLGVLISIILYEFFEKRISIKNKILKFFFYFLLYTIVLSLVELVGGHLIRMIFSVDLWNYSSHVDAIGKYICVTNCLIWGILGTLNIYFVYPVFKRLLKKIPHIYTYVTLIIFTFDFIITIINKVILR